VQSIAHGVLSMKRVISDFGAERRQLQVIKMRGRQYENGSHDYTIVTGGLMVFPRLKVSGKTSTGVLSLMPSGIPELDDLLGGGLERGTGSLIIGPAGAGKSSIAAKYAECAAERGEKTVILLFDENLHTYVKRAADLGMDISGHIRTGRIVLRHLDAAEISPGEMAHLIVNMVDNEGFQCVVIDSLNGYLNAMPDERFLILQMHELLTFLNQQGVLTLLILAQHGLVGPMETPLDLSYLSDAVLMLRYFEVAGTVRRALSVVKKRSGHHEHTIREFRLGGNGVELGPPLTAFSGIFSGTPTYIGDNAPLLRTVDDGKP
jgi:circadian clock protein KaiC